WLPFWAAFATAVVLRFADLGARPLHHDEGVNAWMVWKFIRGEAYRYDPANFHGPFLFFYAWLPLRLFGLGDTVLRLLVAPVSALMLPLLLPLRRRLGVAGVTGAAWLLAVSPAFVYYGRDLIHETFLAFFTLAMVVCGSLYAETRRERWLMLAAVCLGLLPTIKETFVLTLGTLAVAGLAAWFWTSPGERDPMTPAWIRPRAVALALAVAAVVYVLFFTSFFIHWQGLFDSVRGLILWTRRGAGGDGHEKPWFYFLKLLWEFETATALCALAGAGLAFWRRNGFGVLCALWALGQLALYSAIPYKTPWLVVNILLPAALAAGVFFRELTGQVAEREPSTRESSPPGPLSHLPPTPVPGEGETSLDLPFSSSPGGGRLGDGRGGWGVRTPRASRPAWLSPAILALVALGLVWMGWRTVETSFLRHDDDALTLVYVPTTRQTRDLIATVEEAVARVPKGRRPEVRVFLPYSWPLPWYFRDLEGVGVWTEVQKRFADGDVVLVEGSQDPKLRPLMKDRYVRRRYELRPRTPVVLYVNERLNPPPSAP
ncbi:MAG TPA: flippase activity-associated protein Agl23, partial [Thermoanaerobaculia bacterium]|nr:flippase activity-associated protein Agl23 [Thermoanaerobaculia bacterium]